MQLLCLEDILNIKKPLLSQLNIKDRNHFLAEYGKFYFGSTK